MLCHRETHSGCEETASQSGRRLKVSVPCCRPPLISGVAESKLPEYKLPVTSRLLQTKTLKGTRSKLRSRPEAQKFYYDRHAHFCLRLQEETIEIGKILWRHWGTQQSSLVHTLLMGLNNLKQRMYRPTHFPLYWQHLPHLWLCTALWESMNSLCLNINLWTVINKSNATVIHFLCLYGLIGERSICNKMPVWFLQLCFFTYICQKFCLTWS